MPKKQATAPKKSQTDKKSEPADPTLEKVIKDFDASWKYTSTGHHDRWDRNENLYNNKRWKRGYFGISDTFVPMTFSTVETKVSALFGAKPKWNYTPPKDKADQKTDTLNAKIDEFWERDQWSIKVIHTGRSGIKKGNGIEYYGWDIDHPIILNVPLRDFFIDPNATNFENARYMGRRYLTSLEELKSFQVTDMDADADEDGNQPQKQKYENLDKLEEIIKGKASSSNTKQSSQQETTDKEEKDIFYGSTVEGQDQVEVIEWWGFFTKEDGTVEEKVISIANRAVLIEDCENYFLAKAKANNAKNPRGIMPFGGFRCYTDESQFYARSEVDIIADQQEDLNDITNQNKDAISFVLNPMYTLDPKYGDQIQTVENLPGAVYPFEANTLVPIDQRPIPPDAFNERMNIKAEIREVTASNEVIRGGSQEGKGDQTATEINAQVAGAGQRMNLMVTQIEDEYFNRMGRIIFALMRLYITEPTSVRINGKDGIKIETYDPKDYEEGEYEPRVQLDISIENQKAEEAANAKEMMAAFLNDPEVNQMELKKIVLAKGFGLDPDEVGVLMQPNPVDPMAGADMGMPTDPMAAMMPPMGDPMMGSMPPEMPMDPMAMEAQLPEPIVEPIPEEPQVFIDEATGIPYIIDPMTGEPVPVEMPAI